MKKAIPAFHHDEEPRGTPPMPIPDCRLPSLQYCETNKSQSLCSCLSLGIESRESEMLSVHFITEPLNLYSL